MFGYVKPVTSELLVKDYEFYKATYCGVCRAMKKHTGALSNVTLSYDSVLLALVRMLYVPDSDISAKMRRCIAHPLKKRCMLTENSAVEYTARAFAVLTYHKLLDDIADEKLGKRMLVSAARPIAASGALVPKETTVSPMMSEGTRSLAAIEEAPSTKKSAPLIRKTKPTTSKT